MGTLTCHPPSSIIANTNEGATNAPPAFIFVPHPTPLGFYDDDVLPFHDRATSGICVLSPFAQYPGVSTTSTYVVVGGIPRNLPVVSCLAKTQNETCSVRPSFLLPAVATSSCKDGDVKIRNRPDALCLLLSPLLTDPPKQTRAAVVGRNEAAGTYYGASPARRRASQASPTLSINAQVQP